MNMFCQPGKNERRPSVRKSMSWKRPNSPMYLNKSSNSIISRKVHKPTHRHTNCYSSQSYELHVTFRIKAVTWGSGRVEGKQKVIRMFKESKHKNTVPPSWSRITKNLVITFLHLLNGSYMQVHHEIKQKMCRGPVLVVIRLNLLQDVDYNLQQQNTNCQKVKDRRDAESCPESAYHFNTAPMYYLCTHIKS